MLHTTTFYHEVGRVKMMTRDVEFHADGFAGIGGKLQRGEKSPRVDVRAIQLKPIEQRGGAIEVFFQSKQSEQGL